MTDCPHGCIPSPRPRIEQAIRDANWDHINVCIGLYGKAYVTRVFREMPDGTFDKDWLDRFLGRE